MKKKMRKKYTAEFKKEAVQLAENIGVSQDRWKKEKKDLPIEKSQNVLKLQLEIRKLKKELAEERAIVEMLKKTTAFFSKENLK